MKPSAIAAAASVITLAVASNFPARAAEGLPTYNMDTYCRDLSGGDFAKDMDCGQQEAIAYSTLVETWASVPEARKVECHNVAYDPETGKGSYVQHLDCIRNGRK